MSVQRYTCQEEAVVRRVRTLCGDQVFGFLTVVFTHGDQLPEDMHMVQFVEQSAGLTELVQACGGRCPWSTTSTGTESLRKILIAEKTPSRCK
ncbi:unnamed protein product [Knipowitschia caucasica]